jgi:hypothetical protein
VAVTPLTTAQQRAVDALVAARRLERVPIDEQRCVAFLGQAETALSDLPNVRHAQNRYNLAYDAAHDVGEAMLAAYGCRKPPPPMRPRCCSEQHVFESRGPADRAASHAAQNREGRHDVAIRWSARSRSHAVS